MGDAISEAPCIVLWSVKKTRMTIAAKCICKNANEIIGPIKRNMDWLRSIFGWNTNKTEENTETSIPKPKKRLRFGNRVRVADDSATVSVDCRVSKEGTEFEFSRCKWSLASLFESKRRPIFDSDSDSFIVHQLVSGSIYSELPFEVQMNCTIVFVDPDVASKTGTIRIAPRQPRTRDTRINYIHPWPFHYSVDLIKIFTYASYREHLLNTLVVRSEGYVILDRDEPLYQAYFECFNEFKAWAAKENPKTDTRPEIWKNQDLVYIWQDAYDLFVRYLKLQVYHYLSYVDFNLSCIELVISDRDKAVTPESSEQFLKLARAKQESESLELADARLNLSFDVSARCLCTKKETLTVVELQSGNTVFGNVNARFAVGSSKLTVYQSSLFGAPDTHGAVKK